MNFLEKLFSHSESISGANELARAVSPIKERRAEVDLFQAQLIQIWQKQIATNSGRIVEKILTPDGDAVAIISLPDNLTLAVYVGDSLKIADLKQHLAIVIKNDKVNFFSIHDYKLLEKNDPDAVSTIWPDETAAIIHGLIPKWQKVVDILLQDRSVSI